MKLLGPGSCGSLLHHGRLLHGRKLALNQVAIVVLAHVAEALRREREALKYLSRTLPLFILTAAVLPY